MSELKGSFRHPQSRLEGKRFAGSALCCDSSDSISLKVCAYKNGYSHELFRGSDRLLCMQMLGEALGTVRSEVAAVGVRNDVGRCSQHRDRCF